MRYTVSPAIECDVFPFIPDTVELATFQSYVYQSVDINSCGRSDLEALPFLTPDQIDSVLKHRPYYGWEDFLRRSGLPMTVAYALRGLLRFRKGHRYSRAFARIGQRKGNPSYLFSFKGWDEGYRVRLHLSDRRKALSVGYFGKVRVAGGNYVMSSPLGFAGYGGFYSGGWGPHYSIYAPPSIVVGAGKWHLKVDTVGVVGGVEGRSGGLLITKDWRGKVGGVGYVRQGPLVVEAALSRRGTGFGVGAVRNGVGFRLRYVKGEGFWSEGSFRTDYALWASVPIGRYAVRGYVSSEKRRVSITLTREGYRLRVEYYEVPRVTLGLEGVEAGICPGCMWVGYRWRWGWVRAYSFTEDGIHLYEGGTSSHLITSKVGYRASFGLSWKYLGAEGYVQNREAGWYLWIAPEI